PRGAPDMNRMSRNTGGEAGSFNTGTANTRKTGRLPIDRQRAEFLRSCRARIKPSDLGLPLPQRKRTDGLRREDVAALSGVSVSWNGGPEGGGDRGVQEGVREQIAHPSGRREEGGFYFSSLAHPRPPRLHKDSRFEAPAEIVRMINGVAAPAVVMNLRWDV